MLNQEIDVTALKSLVEDSGISFRQNSVSWIFTCPKCSKKDKLYLRKRDGQFVCWYCATTEGYRGRPEFALRDLLSMPIADIKARLYGEDGFHYSPGSILGLPPLEDFFDREEFIPYSLVPLKEVPFPLDYYPIEEPEAKRGLDYLAGRGIDLALAQRYGVRYFPENCRVIFPVVVDGRTVGWQGRTVIDDSMKILTDPKGLDRNRCLMFQDRLKGSRHAVMTEGPIDAIKCDLCGGNVSAMGKSVSRGQLQILRDAGIESLYLGVDPDAAAEMTRLCREMADFKLYHLTPAPGFKDLGEMSPEGVLERFRVAPRVSAANVFLPPLRDWQ